MDDFPPAPTEPSSDMRTFAHVCREMFIALQQEGFSHTEAMTIIGQTIAGSFGSSS